MDNKICRICGKLKTLNDFHKKCDTRDGHRSECKQCMKEIQKKYQADPTFKKNRSEYDKKRYEEKKEQILQRKKEYHQENRESILEKKRKYRESNKENLNNKRKEKYKNDLVYREKNKNYKKIKRKEWNEYCKRFRKEHSYEIAWRSILYSTLKRLGTKKEGHTIDILGYSALDLKNHIESLFTPGMSWDNRSEWHIDHIIAVSNFPKDTLISEVCSLENLQPLWKSTKIIDGIEYIGNLNKNNKIS